MNNITAKLRQIAGRIQGLLVRYVITVVCAVVCIVLLFIGSGIRGSAKSDLNAAKRELGDIRNQIDQNNVAMQDGQNVTLVTAEGSVVDYDEARYKRDVTSIATFLSKAFQFTDANDYNAKRTAFHKLICSDAIAESNRGDIVHDPDDCKHQHEIFKYFLTKYDPEWIEKHNESISLGDDGMVFSSTITKITPYVVQINSNKTVDTEHDDTSIYSYMLDVELEARVPRTYHGDYILAEQVESNFYEGPLSVAVTCDVQANGSITNFHVVSEADEVFLKRGDLVSADDIAKKLEEMYAGDDE